MQSTRGALCSSVLFNNPSILKASAYIVVTPVHLRFLLHPLTMDSVLRSDVGTGKAHSRYLSCGNRYHDVLKSHQWVRSAHWDSRAFDECNCWLQIDNLQIEASAPEIPIMDGSAIEFVQVLQQAGIAEQTSAKRYIPGVANRLRFAWRIKSQDFVPTMDFVLDFQIDFNHPAFNASHQKSLNWILMKAILSSILPKAHIRLFKRYWIPKKQ